MAWTRCKVWSAIAVLGLVGPLWVESGGVGHATYQGAVGRLAFGMSVDGNVDVYTAAADGTGLRKLTSDPGFDACPAYSPGGRQIAFCSNRSGKFEIWMMGSGGGHPRQLTHLGGRSLFPDFSASGHHVAFGGGRDPEALPDIWRVRSDGTRARRLTYTPHLADDFPVWRPGHEQIAFLRFDAPGLGSQVWLMDADGTHQRPLTFDDTAKDQVPDWSPDGRRLAYVADGDVWVMRADGSRQRNLTQSDAEEFGAAWSPDGARIAFIRDEGSTRPIYSMAADGTNEQVLLPGNENLQFVPAWQAAPPADDCLPRIRDLGTLPGGVASEILAMNDDGLVVGDARTARGVGRAVIWRRGRIHDLGLRGGAWAADVNDRGVVVGNFAIDESNEESLTGHAFVWRRGEAHRLPGLGGDAEFARRINEYDQIVGAALGPLGREHPVMWRRGHVHSLGIPDGFDGAFALGINDRGDVVGLAYSETDAMAWAWDADGGSHPLDRLGTFSQANVVDNAGRAMGLSDFGGNPGAYAALWSGRRLVEPLGVFGASDFSFALGTSGKGDVVGVGDYYAGEGTGHVFLRRVVNYDVARTVVQPLLTLTPLSGDPADFSSAHAVLSSARPTGSRAVTVGGESLTTGGEEHATLWTCAYQQAFVPGDELTDPAVPAQQQTQVPDGFGFDRLQQWRTSP